MRRPCAPTAAGGAAPRAVPVAALAAVAVAGCGADQEERPRRQATATEPRATIERRTVTEGDATQTLPPEERPETGSPEDRPGGVGDEEPARVQALLTARGGRIRPRLVRVPSYIAVRVELRSADGRPYALRIGRRTLRSGGSLRIAGLRPREALTARPVGAGNAVRIEASAEPGP